MLVHRYQRDSWYYYFVFFVDFTSLLYGADHISEREKKLHIIITVKDSLYFKSTMPKMHINPLLTVSIHTFELIISPVIKRLHQYCNNIWCKIASDLTVYWPIHDILPGSTIVDVL